MKRAVVDVAGDALARCASVLTDHGLRIVGSLPAPDYLEGCRLILEGDCLPEECAGERLLMVRVLLTQEAYGEQRMTKVSGIEVTGEAGRRGRAFTVAAAGNVVELV